MNRGRISRWMAGWMGLAGSVWLAGAEAPVALPPPQTSGGMPLMEALSLRRSQREISPDALPDELLSSLLWAATGVNRPATGYRTVPSARNWKGIDVYVARADGLFHYLPDEHRLQKTLAEDVRPMTGKQPFVQQAPVVLIFVADHSRMADAPREVVEFYAATDTGYISQNVYLFCAANDLATVAVGWVDKPALGTAMQLGEHRQVILTQPVGRSPSASPPPPVEEAAAAPAWRDGTFAGVADGYLGDVAVEVTIDSGRIEAITVVDHMENRPLDALEAIPQAILEAQGVAGVDAVTGATITSRAVKEAVQEALERAAE